ncbi:hypothetical protein BpHYR1_044342 [Brachionus plicatilis]|uniref:Uncharacterized protein n=1 Tax=Brachionus plicatilis TaxID=10195 RepID=A0A3M7QQ80_BRAPC|nr:hypothetical protein BpHYR1_044342 [Brachionus plicatilis]
MDYFKLLLLLAIFINMLFVTSHRHEIIYDELKDIVTIKQFKNFSDIHFQDKVLIHYTIIPLFQFIPRDKIILGDDFALMTQNIQFRHLPQKIQFLAIIKLI